MAVRQFPLCTPRCLPSPCTLTVLIKNTSPTWLAVWQGVKALGEKLSFARDARLGSLTFCPSNLGTSLRASVLVNIPTLSQQPNFQATLDKLHLQCRGQQ